MFFRKEKKQLRLVTKWYERKKKLLSKESENTLLHSLEGLRLAILNKNKAAARQHARDLDVIAEKHLPRTWVEKVRDYTAGLLVALLVAVVVRTMWFELYTIPTGSMRPTLKEEDYLIVSKTDFGLNVPLQEKHFTFDEESVQRGNIFVFNGANIDLEDADTMYFYLFPGKKQFVKRLVGKPGDTIYFYGGNVYGVDEQGKAIDLSAVNVVEHIPMIRFDGRVETGAAQNGKFPIATFSQMGQEIAKLKATSLGTVTATSKTKAYADFLGMKHFAMARLLTSEQARLFHGPVEDAHCYLELTHTPSLTGAELGRDEYNRLRPLLKTQTSLIPLTEEHLASIAKHMTTCRFAVKGERAYRLGWNPKGMESYLPKLPGVPDGVYEIQNGEVVKLPFPNIPIIGLFTNGITWKVAKDHPLYEKKHTMTLYNLGIEFFDQYAPRVKKQTLTPSRYAYFKNGDLYLLGHAIIKAKDIPEISFKDAGEPSLEEIMKNGVRVPDHMYMALGDNHAMSADSRHFGFVPEENIKGKVSLLFGPIDNRLGMPAQPKTSFFNMPNILAWTVFGLSFGAYAYYHRRKLHRPL